MGGWQETPSTVFRSLEQEQRALAKDAASEATRDIHLEFAERYRQQAEQLELKEGRGGAPNSESGRP